MVQKQIELLQTLFSILLSFVLSCIICIRSSELLLHFGKSVFLVLNPEVPKHGSTVAVMGKLQVALPYERLYQINFENK